MASYTTITGDTFASISRKKYGTELDSYRISDANPGASSPLTPGTNLIIPPPVAELTSLPQQTIANDINEVAVMISGIRFRFWSTISITRSIDSFDTITLASPFDPDNLDMRSIFIQLSYQSMVITVGGQPYFTGTMIGIDPSLQLDNTLSINAYSKPGVLNDVTAPASTLQKLEFNNVNLLIIANSLCSVFGIAVVLIGSPGPVFEKVAIKPTEKILSFLTKLAKERDFVINSTETGQLRFEKSVDAAAPIAYLEEGQSPLLSIQPKFNPQEYYSHITGISPASSGSSGFQYTKVNTYLAGVVRTLTFTAEDTTKADLQEAVRSKMARMFGNVVSYSLSVATWRDPQGQLWKPNTLINIFAPRVMIYSSYNFLIRSVILTKDNTSEKATLKLVLPGSFSGRIPDSLPWL